MVINVFMKEDEKVIIQPPVYHPFRLVPQKNHREVVFNPLRELPEGGYEMDFENLEAVCDNRPKSPIHRSYQQNILPYIPHASDH